MFSSRNIITLVLLIAVAALGWVGGSRFTTGGATDAPGHAAGKPSAQADAHEEKAEKGHEGHNHGAETDGHGKPADAGEICAEHRMPEAVDVLCNPGLMTTLLPGEGVKMRLATPEAAKRAGIVITPAQSASLATGAAVPAQVTYNRSRLAEVMALSGGVVRRIAAEPGQCVGKGTLLAEVASPGAAIARGDYQAALGRLELAEANVKREQELVAKGVSARMELEQAQAEQQAAKATVEPVREQLSAFGAGTSAGAARYWPCAHHWPARSWRATPWSGRRCRPKRRSSPWRSLQHVAGVAGQRRPAEHRPRSARPSRRRLTVCPACASPERSSRWPPGSTNAPACCEVVAEMANPDGLLKDGSFGQARLVAAPPKPRPIMAKTGTMGTLTAKKPTSMTSLPKTNTLATRTRKTMATATPSTWRTGSRTHRDRCRSGRRRAVDRRQGLRLCRPGARSVRTAPGRSRSAPGQRDPDHRRTEPRRKGRCQPGLRPEIRAAEVAPRRLLRRPLRG